MTKKNRSRVDLLQNLAIVLLTLSAVFFYARSQFYTLGLSAKEHGFSHFAPSAPITAVPGEPHSTMSIPLRAAVTGTHGRSGDLRLTTSDPDFEPLGTLLNEVLSSTKAFSACSQEDFLGALSSGSSVYYDFGFPLPLSVLSRLLGLPPQEDEVDLLTRRLIVSAQEEDETVSLYLWDDGEHWRKSTTTLSPSVLLDTVNLYELGSAAFALDLDEPDVRSLSPLTLFLGGDESPDLPVLTASSSVGSMDFLLTALNFNPRTNLRYLDADGTEVIIEGERSLRIAPSGILNYQSGGETMLSIHSHGQTPTLWEAAVGTDHILNAMFREETDVILSLCNIRQNGNDTILQFNYAIDGLPILFTDGIPAAEVHLHGSVVSSLKLRYRRYTPSPQSSLLLPLRQALAITAQNPGRELSLCYADRGGETVSAEWLSQ